MELKEYAKYVKEQCNNICGFFIDDYGEIIEMYNYIVFVSIVSEINAHSDNNHCTCEVECDVYFGTLNNRDDYTKAMKKSMLNKPCVRNIIAEIKHKGEELARLLVQEKPNMNVRIHEITSTYDMRRKV